MLFVAGTVCLYAILYKCDTLFFFAAGVYTVGNNVNMIEIEKSSLTLANDERLAQHRRIKRSKNTLIHSHALTSPLFTSLHVIVVVDFFSTKIYFVCGFCITIDRAFFLS